MNRHCRNLTITMIICAMLLSFVPPAAGAEPLAPVEYDNISIGGGGSFYSPMIDPSDPDHYVVLSDMSGLYYSHDRGESWQRNNCGRVYTGCIADDGTVFAGGYGLSASTDGGQTLELIYPRQEDVQYAVNRMGRIDGIIVADGYDNGYVVSVAAREDWVYFISLNWSTPSQLRLMRSRFDGTELELLYTESRSVSPMSVEYLMVVEEGRIVWSDGSKVWQFDLQSRQMELLYTAGGTIQDFDRVGDQYFLLVENTSQTDILYTSDFTDWSLLNDFNTLTDTFWRGGVEYQIQWRFSNLCGNNFENIYLTFYSPVVGTNAVSGVLKFDGESFQWIYDTVFTWNQGSDTDFGWITYTFTAAYGMCADPSDDSYFLVANIETVFGVSYEDGSRYVQNLGCATNGDGTYTTRGLDCQTNYFVREDPFDPDHIAVCSTDLGLQLSYDGGESFRRMQMTWERITNTCYDLYFDPNTPDLVYGLWSSRHDAPYCPSLSDSTAVGGFSVSRDGGVSWEHYYGQGIPTNSIPVKMSVVPNGDQLTIAVATFNNGFYLSQDSGKTFTSISDGMETYQGMIWGSDVVIAGDEIYCLTASHEFAGRTPASLYRYSMTTGQVTRLELGDIVLARSLTYHEDHGLFVSVTPFYRSEYVPAIGRYNWVNYGGGVYRVEGDGVVLEHEVYNGAYHCEFTSDGTMYIAGELGQVYVSRGGELELYADGLFPRLKNISFSSDEMTMYVSSLGGGLYRMPVAEPEYVNSLPTACTVTFLDYDGTLLEEQTVSYGCAAEAGAVPERAADENYHYTFLDWDTDLSEVTRDLTVTALYEAADHEPVTTDAREPGCTDEGYSGDVSCGVCGIALESGSMIPALGHDAQLQGAVEATCTAEGYTGDQVCIECGLVVEQGGVIPALGHNAELQGVVEATCTADGYTGDQVCIECGLVVEQGSVIPALGHSTGSVRNLGVGTHGWLCLTCGELMGQEYCADENADGTCDVCGEAVPGQRFVPVQTLEEGKRYLMVSNGYTVAKSLRALAVTMTQQNGYYIADREITEQMLFTCNGGMLSIDSNGKHYYLYLLANNSYLAFTGNTKYANIWTYENGLVKTHPANVLWKAERCLSLKPGGTLTASDSGTQFQLYELLP